MPKAINQPAIDYCKEHGYMWYLLVILPTLAIYKFTKEHKTESK